MTSYVCAHVRARVRAHTHPPLWVPVKYIKYCFLGKQFIWQYDTFILSCSYWMLEFVAGDFQVFSCWNGVLGFHQGPRNTWGGGDYSARARKRHT